jgi:DhnA family fructose-bisphosphate aldolase class Ia
MRSILALILPVDQGVERDPARSFGPNPPAYDPHYHFELALEAGLSAYAAPLGFIEAGASTFGGQIPLILKLDNANSMARLKGACRCRRAGPASGCRRGSPWCRDLSLS